MPKLIFDLVGHAARVAAPIIADRLADELADLRSEILEVVREALPDIAAAAAQAALDATEIDERLAELVNLPARVFGRLSDLIPTVHYG